MIIYIASTKTGPSTFFWSFPDSSHHRTNLEQLLQGIRWSGLPLARLNPHGFFALEKYYYLISFFQVKLVEKWLKTTKLSTGASRWLSPRFGF